MIRQTEIAVKPRVPMFELLNSHGNTVPGSTLTELEFLTTDSRQRMENLFSGITAGRKANWVNIKKDPKLWPVVSVSVVRDVCVVKVAAINHALMLVARYGEHELYVTCDVVNYNSMPDAAYSKLLRTTIPAVGDYFQQLLHDAAILFLRDYYGVTDWGRYEEYVREIATLPHTANEPVSNITQRIADSQQDVSQNVDPKLVEELKRLWPGTPVEAVVMRHVLNQMQSNEPVDMNRMLGILSNIHNELGNLYRANRDNRLYL